MKTGGFPELVCGASHDGGTVVTLDYESSRGETENRSGRPVGVLGSYPRNPIPLGDREDVNSSESGASPSFNSAHPGPNGKGDGESPSASSDHPPHTASLQHWGRF